MGDSTHEIWVKVNGERFLVQVEDPSQRPVVAFVDGVRFEIDIDEGSAGSGEDEKRSREETRPGASPGGGSRDVTAPMPGDIIQIHVKIGQAVKAGDPLCVLDAMKMKNTIHAPQDGSIAEIFVSEGQSVEYGVQLFRLG